MKNLLDIAHICVASPQYESTCAPSENSHEEMSCDRQSICVVSLRYGQLPHGCSDDIENGISFCNNHTEGRQCFVFVLNWQFLFCLCDPLDEVACFSHSQKADYSVHTPFLLTVGFQL